ncbi:hypothetical protein GGX14DRAFT_399811 [Mycena pura]|uniref:Uncharacterized protein n=1 Tax=Mycena pura TaxID=153505 RepID=A0AAD6V3H9_9AGAR|nr:hypothetical protein GGX14DRAFT_399811 [Mycena pura]
MERVGFAGRNNFGLAGTGEHKGYGDEGQCQGVGMEISTDHRLRKFEPQPAHKTIRVNGVGSWSLEGQTTQIINGMAGWLAQTSSFMDINSEAYTMMPGLGVFASATAVGRINGRRRRNRSFQNLSVVSANETARMGIGIKDHTGLMERNGSRGSGQVLTKLSARSQRGPGELGFQFLVYSWTLAGSRGSVVIYLKPQWIVTNGLQPCVPASPEQEITTMRRVFEPGPTICQIRANLVKVCHNAPWVDSVQDH